MKRHSIQLKYGLTASLSTLLFMCWGFYKFGISGNADFILLSIIEIIVIRTACRLCCRAELKREAEEALKELKDIQKMTDAFLGLLKTMEERSKDPSLCNDEDSIPHFGAAFEIDKETGKIKRVNPDDVIGEIKKDLEREDKDEQ